MFARRVCSWMFVVFCVLTLTHCTCGGPPARRCSTALDCVAGDLCLQGVCSSSERGTGKTEYNNDGGVESNGDDKPGGSDAVSTEPDQTNPDPFTPLESCTNRQDDDNDGLIDCADPDCGGHPACKTGQEICTNRFDDDGDGLVDCADPDCNASPSCQTNQENCSNRADDDGDGLVDCADPDCVGYKTCNNRVEICTNRFDDDGDGKVDCDDPDCKNNQACQNPGKEDCSNRIDDDGDGLIDCNDPNCAKAANCQGVQEICANQKDDDGDGLTDCKDPDCRQHWSCQFPPEICNNKVDDDKDGKLDCDDSDCSRHWSCQTTRVEFCGNNRDDDGDGLVDCDDPDCKGTPQCLVPKEVCNNNIDDDRDGLVDCDDPDCKMTPSCQKLLEVCNNNRDDDGDGLVDCDDPDCQSEPVCFRPPENCTNKVDDDFDGKVDCDDPDCQGEPACKPPKENCTNKVDDNNNKLVDCDDPDCKQDPACQSIQEVCNNQKDDDGDGLIDCKDPDCASNAICRGSKEVCNNQTDDDGDGFIDCKDPDCFTDPVCKTLGQEICNNKIDDDKDGQIDCADPDCKSSPVCQSTGLKEVCNNKVDDDKDGATDCADPDCANDPSCQTNGCVAQVDFGTLASSGGTSSKTLTTTGKNDTLSSVCVPGGGGDIVGTFALSGASDLLVSWTQTGDHAFSVYRAGSGQACNQNPYRCIDPSSKLTGKESLLNVPAGRYYIIAEAYGKGLEGQVSITLTTGSTTVKENCGNGIDDDGDGAIDCKDRDCASSQLCSSLLCQPQYQLGALVPGGQPRTVSADTRSAKNVYDLNCSAGGGKDIVIAFTFLVPGGLDIRGQNLQGHRIGIVPSAGPGTRCDAGQVNCAIVNTNPYRVLFNNMKPGDYYLIVDASQPGNEGAFSITLSVFGQRGTELCNNGIDDDGDGAIDCLDTDCAGVGSCPGAVCKPDYAAGTLTPGGPSKQFNLDISKESNAHRTTCAKGDAKEAVISVTLGAVSGLAVSCNQGSNSDHVIALLSAHKPRDPCDQHPLSCVDIKGSPIGCNFAWPNLQPGKYYLIVEGFQPGSEGTFNLNLQAFTGQAQEICNNGVDDDGDGLIDCADFNCTSSPLCAGKTCAPDKVVGALTPGGKTLSTAVTTSNNGDKYKTICASSSGEEAVIGFTMAKQADLEVDYAQFGDHVIGLYADKGTGLSCSASPQGCQKTGGKASGKIVFKSVPIGKYFLIIDADKVGQEGSVLLKLTAK